MEVTFGKKVAARVRRCRVVVVKRRLHKEEDDLVGEDVRFE